MDYSNSYDYSRDREVKKFWSRLKGRPDLKKKKVLDFGCGYGNLSFDCAYHGASHVVGLDLNKKLIDNCIEKRNSLKNNECQFDFMDKDILATGKQFDQYFDYIVSFSTLEHVLNLENVYKVLLNKLKPGGTLYLGFGPLYYSPFGDHGIISKPVPWKHLIFKNDILKSTKRNNIEELGFNGLKYNDYYSIFCKNHTQIFYCAHNVSNNLIAKLVKPITYIPIIKDYFIFNMYAILKKEH